MAEEALADFMDLYHSKWLTGMRRKLGIFNEEKEDEALINQLLELMSKNKADYTNTFRALTLDEGIKQTYLKEEFRQWHQLAGKTE